ncbi:MAG TPA: PfkB family carbohydrate kinase [Anaerolineaceae bacterium]|nr:PfkB family carbohydrate kinase [Anaerolineaceae bacterium]
MLNVRSIEPVDYLVIGHLTNDITPQGPVLGGTAAYASLTAQALGLRVGVVTAWGNEFPLTQLQGVQVAALPVEHSTTFENVYTPAGRVQTIYHHAAELSPGLVPDTWLSAPIVHLGPVDQEIDPLLIRAFPSALLGMTPQGWLRDWDNQGHVHACEWPEARFVLEKASAAVISIEDVVGDESRIEEIASAVRILVVTEGAAGCRLYWNGDLRHFRAPEVKEIDPIGAGDIFAACFFSRLYTTRDPWEAARFATHLASMSVTRPYLQGIPTPEEVQASLIQVL